MEIGAILSSLEISAGDPAAIARFHAAAFDMNVEATSVGTFVCTAAQRRLVFCAGEPGQLRRATFAFSGADPWKRQVSRMRDGGLDCEVQGLECTVADPEGRLITFVVAAGAEHANDAQALVARLQHFAVRTPSPKELVEFYTQKLGFILSDRVVDERGALSAAFMRTDAEHHAMAIFRAPSPRFDHFSCETGDWSALRDWADRMADLRIPLAWGVGRHGPGNDTFFMVRDADGNMGEISSDLEVCAPERPTGQWAHEPATLNRWGVAIMRS